MKFSLESKQVVLPSSTETAPTMESISYAYEGLLSSYMELTDAQRNLDEVCQVMENIKLSMKMLNSGYVDVIKLLNIDKSLECLLGINEDQITVELVNEGLKCAELSAMEGFVDGIKAFIQKIIEFCKRFILKIQSLRSLRDNSEKFIQSITDEQIHSVMRTSDSHVSTETVSIRYYNNRLIYDVGSKSLYDLLDEEDFKSLDGFLFRVEQVQNVLLNSLSDFKNGVWISLSKTVREESDELDDVEVQIDNIFPSSSLGIKSKSDLRVIYDRSKELSDYGVELISHAKSFMEDSRLKNIIGNFNGSEDLLRSVISVYARIVKIVTPIVSKAEHTSKICVDFAKEIRKQSKLELT